MLEVRSWKLEVKNEKLKENQLFDTGVRRHKTEDGRHKTEDIRHKLKAKNEKLKENQLFNPVRYTRDRKPITASSHHCITNS
jgi:hypothetical protein